MHALLCTHIHTHLLIHITCARFCVLAHNNVYMHISDHAHITLLAHTSVCVCVLYNTHTPWTMHTHHITLLAHTSVCVCVY